MKSGIKVNHLHKHFQDVKALQGVSFLIDKPGLYGLIGPNGAGKTTLLKCISGLLIPTDGSVFANGNEVISKDLSFRNKIGFLPEDSGLYDILTAKEFLHIMAGMHGISKDKRGKRVEEVVNFVGIDYPPSKIIKYLSTGQRRLLLFASILLHEPDIIILDESLSGLDPINRERLSQIMRKLSDEKIVIFSSHILSDIWRLCERILVLKEGKMLVDGIPANILSEMSDNTFYVTSKDIEAILKFLRKSSLVEDIREQSGKIVFKIIDAGKIQELVADIIKQFDLSSFGPNIPDLDQIFTRLVNSS
jgi:ABC-2 type transport system ATP-binding protein